MLKPFKPVVYRPISQTTSYAVECDKSLLSVRSDRDHYFSAAVERFEDKVLIDSESESSDSMMTMIALEAIFGHNDEVQTVKFKNGGQEAVSRSVFYQNSQLWLASHNKLMSGELKNTITNGYEHPVRPGIKPGVYYRRYLPLIDMTISFRLVDVEKDLERFHRWHNNPRVYDLWELNKPIEELRDYLEKGLADPHLKPMILEFNDEPVGYFEIYWAAEDRLGPHYDRSAYDRGFHFLIGEDRFLGRANTDQVVRSVTHLLFLDDQRTDRIVAEPRSDNQRVLEYARLVPGWRFIKEFDFPHKRAALVSVRREDFFGEGKAP